MAQSSGSREGGGRRYALFAEIGGDETGSVHVGRLVGAAGAAPAVAIKKLSPALAKDPDFVATFLDEVGLAARVQHANVVPTLDVVRDGGDVLVVTALVTGESLALLAEAVRTSGQRLDPPVACAILAGVLHGLHAAHDAKNEFSEPLGIVHGGVSPRNILVGTDGVPRLVDFGVARAVRQMPQTRRPPMKGKPRYMAPAQIRGAAPTRVSDVWGATVVLWELLTGEPLFHAADDDALAQCVLCAPIRDPSELTPKVPPALDAIVRKGLERDPKQRFATAGQMAAAIEQAAPVALPSEVGATVERMCGEAIATRAERIRESASAPATQGLPATPIVPSREFIADALWGGQDKTHPPLAHPNLSPEPADVAQGLAKRQSPQVPRSGAARRWGIGALMVGVTGLLVFGAALLSIPWYAKERVIATAAARGLSVTIDDATGGLRGVTFHGVTASVPEMPGARATLADLELELRGLELEKATLGHAEVSLDGSPSKTLALAALWYAHHQGSASEARSDNGVHVVVPSAHLVWSHAFGEDGKIEAADITGDLVPATSNRIGDEFQFTTPKLIVTSNAGAIGPWRVDLERDPDALHARIAFDPPVPDGPTAMITRMNTGKISVEVNIPRSPLDRIGIPPSVLAKFHHLPDQAEVKLHYARTPDDRADAFLTATIFGVHAPPFTGPIDVKISGSLAGNASGPLDLLGGTLTVGPVHATVAGPVLIQDGVRATLTWKTVPIPCAQLLPKSEHAATDLAGQLGSLGAGGGDLTALGIDVTALAQSAGLARVSGNLSESGTLVFDSNDLSGMTFAATGKNSCGISLFGP